MVSSGDQPSIDKNAAILSWLLFMGDNAVVLSHRTSEWCGHAPALEEDIALANTALDLLGQAQLWLSLAKEFDELGRDADTLAYKRDGHLYCNALLLELPNENIGNTLMRQFLFDTWHVAQLAALQHSSEQGIVDIAGKAIKEARYHLERSSDLVIRLGDGTAESHEIMQTSLDHLWSYTHELMDPKESDAVLIADRVIPEPTDIAVQWSSAVKPVLQQATLQVPESPFQRKGGRHGHHTEHLGYLLAEMQFLPRAYPGAVW